MTRLAKPDICVIGAGSGGLSVAAGAAQLGARTILIERGEMGGDCLNFGCVPSKSLIAAADAAHTIRTAGRFGVDAGTPAVDMARVRAHVRSVIARIAPHDSVERFEGLGVRVVREEGRFVAPDAVEAGDLRIEARRFVVAAGSRPAVPPIPGLDGVAHLTNETIFDLERLPEHLLVVGAGPIGCELAQAFRRLGSTVTAFDMGPMLPNDDPELVEVVRRALIAEGVNLREKVAIARIEPGPRVVLEGGEAIEGSDLLIAAGRKPNVEALDLPRAGIETNARGIVTDASLRTTNRRVYAIGDVAGRLQFTHVAGHHGSLVIRHALFRLPVNVESAPVPWVTYTDPELAHVGLTEAGAKQRGLAHQVIRIPFTGNDRALTEATDTGSLKLIASKRGRVLGVSIVGRHAGDLVLPWVLAIQKKHKLSTLASVIAPYPTRSEITKRAAGSFYAPKLFGSWSKRLVGFLTRFG
ncbi:MAG: FAD-dependent oxidoreductase [Geminicoccaceae bacterium]|nr:FAD-dependent oxidoreductase [Geminicoccaceae bacterium]